MRAVALISLAACMSAPARPKCGAPHPIESLSGIGISVSLSADRLELLFTSSKDGGFNIYDARRTSTDKPFDATRADALIDNPMSSVFDDLLSPDGNTLYYITGDGNVGGTVYSARRNAALARGWDGDAVDPAFARLGNIGHPTFTADMLDVYYHVFDHEDGTVYLHDLMHASRASTDDPFDRAEAIAGINTPDSDEFDAGISPDGERLYYSTNYRPDQIGEKIFVATKAKNFADSTLVDSIEQDDSDYEFGAVHSDGATLVYSSSALGNGQQPWMACE